MISGVYLGSRNSERWSIFGEFGEYSLQVGEVEVACNNKDCSWVYSLLYDLLMAACKQMGLELLFKGVHSGNRS